MRPQGRIARLLALESRYGGDGKTCGGCGAPVDPPAVPGRLSRDEIEAHVLAIVGGLRFASWPRCPECRRLVMPNRTGELVT
jgi:hypothetical protein